MLFYETDGATAADSVKAIGALNTVAVQPKRSVSSIVASALAQSCEEGAAPLIVIDQVNMQVVLAEPTPTISTALATGIAAGMTGKELLAVTLTGDTTDVTNPTTKLVFEGGPTS